MKSPTLKNFQKRNCPHAAALCSVSKRYYLKTINCPFVPSQPLPFLPSLLLSQFTWWEQYLLQSSQHSPIFTKLSNLCCHWSWPVGNLFVSVRPLHFFTLNLTWHLRNIGLDPEQANLPLMTSFSFPKGIVGQIFTYFTNISFHRGPKQHWRLWINQKDLHTWKQACIPWRRPENLEEAQIPVSKSVNMCLLSQT